MDESKTPFDSIEAAQEYLTLLLDEIEVTLRTVDCELADTSGHTPRAFQLVFYSLSKLSNHIKASLKILRDLNRLQRLLYEPARIAEYSTVSKNRTTKVCGNELGI